ncbi:MAG TPA: lysylphosphatidylglycerol synthase transmembrane domain-containing protein [Woeseiaceae bacterium]
MLRALKIAVACVLLALLALGVDWDTLPKDLALLDGRLASLALAAIGCQMIVNAWKWSHSLRLHDLRFAWPYLFRSSCFAYFFNNFLPSGIGGDVYRVYRTMSPGVERSRPVSAVLLERAVGFAAMLAIGAIGALFLAGTSELARLYLFGVSGIAVVLLGVTMLWSIADFDGLRRRLARVAWLEPVRANLRRVGRHRLEWIALAVACCAFQLLAAAVIFLAFAALGSPVSMAAAAVITAAAGIASVLPISISGLGVVEGSIVGTAVGVGVDYDAAVLAAVTVRVLSLLVAAGCGLLYLVDSGRGAKAPTHGSAT